MNERHGGGIAIAYLLLIAFGAYVAFRYYRVQVSVQKVRDNSIVAPAGVNFYCNAPVTHRYQQTQAYQLTNCCQATEPGYAPAFGPSENQPETLATFEI